MSSSPGARADFDRLRDTVAHWIAFVGVRRIVASGASVLLVGVGGWLLVRGSAAPIESSIPRASATVPGGATTVLVPVDEFVAQATTVKVHVAGAVRRPGVYELAVGSRVVDAVRAAGGAVAAADLERINLAQTVIDTEQVYVPRRSYRAPRVTVAPRLRPSRTTVHSPLPTTGASPGSSVAGSTLVNVNSATAAQLDALPGVGPATSKAIVAYRTRKGPFAKVDDLMNVPGIGPAKFAAIRDLVSV